MSFASDYVKESDRVSRKELMTLRSQVDIATVDLRALRNEVITLKAERDSLLAVIEGELTDKEDNCKVCHSGSSDDCDSRPGDVPCPMHSVGYD